MSRVCRPAPTLELQPVTPGSSGFLVILIPMQDVAKNIAFWTLLAAVALAPFPFASVDAHWTLTWLSLLTVGAFAVAFVHQRAVTALLWVVAPAFITATAFAGVVALQNSGWVVEDASEQEWIKAGRLLGGPIAATSTMVQGIALERLIAPTATMLAFLCGAWAGQSRRRYDKLLQVVMFSGLAYAVLGFYQLVFEPGSLLWLEKRAYVNNFTGTFVNRNTAATYFGMCSIIALALSLRYVRRRFSNYTWQEFLHVSLRGSFSNLLGLSFSFLFLLTATLMTGSRAGSLLTIACLTHLTLLYFVFGRRPLGNRTVVLIVSFAAVMFLLGIIGEPLSSTISSRGLGDRSRWSTYLSTLDMIRARPWLGSGLGTFQYVFPAYRRPEGLTLGYWDFAHSTPLEIAAELGMPLAIVIAVWWLLIAAMLLKRSLSAAGSRFAAACGLSVGALGVLHSCVDFSIQIPGFAIPFAAVVSASLSRSLSQTHTQEAVSLQIRRP